MKFLSKFKCALLATVRKLTEIKMGEYSKFGKNEYFLGKTNPVHHTTRTFALDLYLTMSRHERYTTARYISFVKVNRCINPESRSGVQIRRRSYKSSRPPLGKTKPGSFVYCLNLRTGRPATPQIGQRRMTGWWHRYGKR